MCEFKAYAKLWWGMVEDSFNYCYLVNLIHGIVTNSSDGFSHMHCGRYFVKQSVIIIIHSNLTMN